MDQILDAVAPTVDVPVPLDGGTAAGRCLRAARYPGPRAGYQGAQDLVAIPLVSRTVLSEPQTAEQLLEAPTIVSLIEVIEQPVEQTVDIPVPCGRGRRLQGSLPEQNPTAQSAEQAR